MTSPEQENQAQTQEQNNTKEYNFRALEAKMQQERQARLEAEKRAEHAERAAQESLSRKQRESDDDEEDSEPYVDHRKLSRKLASFEQKMEQMIDKKAEEKSASMLANERKQSWLRQNPDFYEVLQHAERFAQKDPELAEAILEMPEGFERQKLVYKNIKALGLHKPEVKGPTIQEKVDANRRSPYYQPSGVANAPYAGAGDFSPVGQKSAYDKMQELKSRLRI